MTFVRMTVDSSRLSEEQQQRYERNGFLFPIRVLDDDEVSHFLAQYYDHIARHEETLTKLPARERYRVTSETHMVMKWAYDIARHPRVLDTVEGILGPNILAWGSTWFSKMPGDKAFVSWHQDGTYWNLTPPRVVTAWIALTPATPANGCMRVVAGTHKQPMMPQRETYAVNNVLSRGQEIDVEVDELQATDLQLAPGEMSLHHLWTVHGSKANTSNIPRIGIAIRYVSTEVHQDSPDRPLAMLVRGNDDYGNFELLAPPTTDVPTDGAQEAAIERVRRSVMQGAQAN